MSGVHSLALPASDQAAIAGPALELISDLTRVPLCYIVHAATNNHNAPLICRGDVVVDTGGAYVTGGWHPVDGGFFLIEYTSPPEGSARYVRRSRDIVQTFIGHRDRWYTGGLRRGIQGRQIFCVSGPFADEDTLADKLIGKVVGLYQPLAQIGGAA